MSIAIINIDLQKDFFKHENLRKVQANLIENINIISNWARKNDYPVFWVRQEFNEDLTDAPLYNKENSIPITIRNTPGIEFLNDLKITTSDTIITKKRFSAFFKTKLMQILMEKDIKTVILTGINTMTCVRTTAIDAYQNDLKVILADNCFYGYDKEQHKNSLKYLQYSVAKLISTENIMKIYSKKTVHNSS